MDRKLRIVLHDYGGHPFPLQLSRALARRGHEVLHLYFPQCQNPVSVSEDQATPGLTARGISIPGPFRKFSFIRRRFQEAEYGRAAAAAIAAFVPDVVISSTTPIDSQLAISAYCRSRKAPLVYWLQDVVSVAMARILPTKIPLAGALIARYYRHLEAGILRDSHAVVAIAEPFVDIAVAMGVARERCHVIENWAPLDVITPQPRCNAWSEEHGLADKRVLLYSGTLGFKHNPSLFERLATHFRGQTDVRIVVVSEGPGVEWLKGRKAEAGLDNLLLLPYQAFERVPEVLAGGDVLLAILEEDAGVFSVPSKILSYLCAGRPIQLSVPLSNLAAATVVCADAGRVAAPRDVDRLVADVDALLADPGERKRLGAQARAYAERTFDIEMIADRFEAILRDSLR